MGSPRITKEQREGFFRYLANGVNAAEAARQLGLSRATASRLKRGIPASSSLAAEQRLDDAQPEPKTWDELSPLAQDCLGDFNRFSEVFLLRRPMSWRLDAANRIVEALADAAQRSYIVMNLPPGSGKSTLCHDVLAWLACGGGICDPLRGRALRAMSGSFGMGPAKHGVARLKRLLESPRPFFDKDTGRTAEFSLVKEYGRFRPKQQRRGVAE